MLRNAPNLVSRSMTGEDGASLRAYASKCRQMARGVATPGVAETLNDIADGYDRKADAAEAEEARSALPPRDDI